MHNYCKIDNMERKRVRSANFTPEEKYICLSLIENYKDILEIKKTNAATWREKEEVWKKIETEFNSHNPAGIKRPKESLKKFYENTKKVNRKLAVKEKYLADLAGSPLAIPKFELDVPDIDEKPMVGLKSEFDDDMTDSSLSKESDDLQYQEVVPCDTEASLCDPENAVVLFDDEVNSVQKKIDTYYSPLEANEIEEQDSLEIAQKKKRYEENRTSKRRSTASAAILAKRYEELAMVKIKCSAVQLDMLKLEKEGVVMKLKREAEENERRKEEQMRMKEEYEERKREQKVQKERDEELHNLKRQSLLLDIEIKKRQLEKLNSA